MNLTTKAEFAHSWDVEVQCPDQQGDGMVDVVWTAIMDNDAIGKAWGPVQSGVSEGISRVRNSYWWGWNNTTVPFDGILGTLVPVCLVYGEFDTQAMHPSPIPLTDFSVPALYAAVPGADKLMIKVACAGHSMPWESRAKDLHHMTRDWLKHTAAFTTRAAATHSTWTATTRSRPSLPSWLNPAARCQRPPTLRMHQNARSEGPGRCPVGARTGYSDTAACARSAQLAKAGIPRARSMATRPRRLGVASAAPSPGVATLAADRARPGKGDHLAGHRP